MPAQTARTPGNGTGTLVYTLTSDSFDVEAVYVSVDNTAGASAVTAELTIKDQSGVVIARKKQAGTIAAGATGSATWALRLDDESTGTGGGGIQFDTYPQAGGFLFAEADSFGGPHGVAIELADPNANGIELNSGFVEIGDVDQGTGQYIRLSGGGVRVDITGGATLNFCEAYNGPSYFAARSTFAGRQISFFGVAPVVRQPTPVTLGDVIALLQAYGLAV